MHLMQYLEGWLQVHMSICLKKRILNNLLFHFKILEKEQTKCKASRKKEINETGNRRKDKNKTKSWFFGKEQN